MWLAISLKGCASPPKLLLVNFVDQCKMRRAREKDADISPATYPTLHLPSFDKSPFAASGRPTEDIVPPCSHPTFGAFAAIHIPLSRFIWTVGECIFQSSGRLPRLNRFYQIIDVANTAPLERINCVRESGKAWAYFWARRRRALARLAQFTSAAKNILWG